MLTRFKDYITQQHLFSPGEEVLLAVSGGRDSVCMAHLFHQASIPFAIAHCNFHLRPGDCDRDEAFVRQRAPHYGVPGHVTHFDTRAVAAATGESIEEAARRLRYEYFASLLPLTPSKIVATAHHRDDSIETFFLNLFRGTGIAGLHGIRPVSELRIKNFELKVVRPLLPFSRAEIDAYIEENHLEYVEDSTNSELDARRNQIRHRLMPLLRELYPSVDTTMAANIERLYDTELIYKEFIEKLRSQLITPYATQAIKQSGNQTPQILSLDLSQLLSQHSPALPSTPYFSSFSAPTASTPPPSPISSPPPKMANSSTPRPMSPNSTLTASSSPPMWSPPPDAIPNPATASKQKKVPASSATTSKTKDSRALSASTSSSPSMLTDLSN